MKKHLFFLIIVLSLPFFCNAQGIGIFDGYPMDSSMIRFNGSIPSGFIGDTASAPLWQMGLTHKAFFSMGSAGTYAIMTDTVNAYPVNANNSFTVKVPLGINTIVDFWHSYQTDSFHAGGMVEFSLDHGLTWQNVKGDCNVDSAGWFGSGTITANFYSYTDTLFNGGQGFTGTSAGQQYSRFQFFQGIPVKTTHGTGCTISADTAYVRFRFVSDTTTDTLAGWMIDSIKIEHDLYEGAVARVNKVQALHVYPNPSADGLFNFPVLENEQEYNIEVYNMLGEKVLSVPYRHVLSLDEYAKGLYLYKVKSSEDYYSGQLIVE